MSEGAFKLLEGKDITADIEIKSGATVNTEREAEGESTLREIPEEDHGLTEMLEMVINFTDDHARDLQSKGVEVPTVNKPLWENFGKPLLNRAFWYYLPDSNGVDDPRLALVAGGAVTVMAVAPTLVGILRYYRQEEEEDKKNKKINEEKPKTVKQAQKDAVKDAAKQAEMEKQRQLEQAIRESPYLKKIKYEEFAGI